MAMLVDSLSQKATRPKKKPSTTHMSQLAAVDSVKTRVSAETIGRAQLQTSNFV